jgi:hypothetical protein
VVAGHRDHHLGDTVAPCLRGEALHQRPVDESGDDRREQDETCTEPGQVRVADPAETGVVRVPGEQAGEAHDELAEHHRAQARTGSDEHRHGEQTTLLTVTGGHLEAGGTHHLHCAIITLCTMDR